MPIVTIQNAGKLTKNQKEDLMQQVTELVTTVTGKPSQSVYVVIEEVPRENFAVGGNSLG